MRYPSQFFVYTCALFCFLNGASAMLGREETGQEEAHVLLAPHPLSRQELQENQLDAFSLQDFPNEILFRIFEFLSPNAQLRLTQINKKFRQFLTHIMHVTARQLDWEKSLSDEFYQWLKGLQSLSVLILGRTQKVHYPHAKKHDPDPFAELNHFLKGSRLSSINFRNNSLGQYIIPEFQQIYGLIESLPETIQEVDLSRNNLWGDLTFFVGVLERLAQKPDLRSLTLSYNKDLGNELWKNEKIWETLAKTPIQALYLEGTSLKSESIQAFLQKAHKKRPKPT